VAAVSGHTRHTLAFFIHPIDKLRSVSTLHHQPAHPPHLDLLVAVLGAQALEDVGNEVVGQHADLVLVQRLEGQEEGLVPVLAPWGVEEGEGRWKRGKRSA
jgi:hypothetical protein